MTEKTACERAAGGGFHRGSGRGDGQTGGHNTGKESGQEAGQAAGQGDGQTGARTPERAGQQTPVSFPELLTEHFGEDFARLIEAHTGLRCLRWEITVLRCAAGQPEAVTTVRVYLRAELSEAPTQGGGQGARAGASPGDGAGAGRERCREGPPSADGPSADILSADDPSAGGVRTEYFCLRYELDLRWGRELCIGPVLTGERFPEENPGDVCDRWLLPVLEEADYVRVAGRLRRASSAVAMADRMGFRVRRVLLEEKETLGMVCFDTTEVTLRKAGGGTETVLIPPDTILVNRALCRTPESETVTIYHECGHGVLDRAFFAIQRMSGKPFRTFCARTLPTRGLRSAALADSAGAGAGCVPIERMEWQAEKLLGYILLPEQETRRYMEHKLALAGGERSPENIRRVLKSLVKLRHVTVGTARRRMMQLGWPEAEGVLRQADGRRIPDYGCGDAWKPGLRYTLSFRAAARMAERFPALAERLQTGEYVYAEGHLCRNTPLWLEPAPDGLLRLTPYARRHVDLCCIPFTVAEYNGDSGEAGGTAAEPAVSVPGAPAAGTSAAPVLPTAYEGCARKKREVVDHYLIPVLLEKSEGAAREEENLRFLEEAKLWADLQRELGAAPALKEAVTAVLDRKGLTWMELALRIGVDRRTLVNWLSRQHIRLEHMVCVCVGLRLRGDLGLTLVELAGCRIHRTPLHDILRMMLMSAPSLTVERCNEILTRQGYPPLHGGEPPWPE